MNAAFGAPQGKGMLSRDAQHLFVSAVAVFAGPFLLLSLAIAQPPVSPPQLDGLFALEPAREPPRTAPADADAEARSNAPSHHAANVPAPAGSDGPELITTARSAPGTPAVVPQPTVAAPAPEAPAAAPPPATTAPPEAPAESPAPPAQPSTPAQDDGGAAQAPAPPLLETAEGALADLGEVADGLRDAVPPLRDGVP